MLQARRALISVSDKTGLADLARGLVALDLEILSTGGTEKALREAGIAVTPVSEVTQIPEILDGRVKTLHPKIHGGILADRQRSSHAAELAEHGIAPIDLVVVNLYPFRETVASGADFNQAVEMIDIGGPTLIRAAAKNHMGVVVVVDPEDYPQVLTALESGEGKVPEALRRRLALKAFRHTQSYDAAIAGWLATQLETPSELFPRQLSLDLARVAELRYGENPHQQAAVYAQARGIGIFGGFVQHQGKELSYNNLLDADAARRLVSLVNEPTVAIIKHTNPCGVGVGDDLVTAYQRALACDPISAFGSIVATNGPIDEKLAEVMSELFIEVVIAPEIDEAAMTLFAAKKNRRVLSAPIYRPSPGAIELRAIDGGYLAQDPDAQPDPREDWRVATERRPSAAERRGLDLAWTVIRHVKSNAIVLANPAQTVGIGAGQMSRVDACKLAVEKAQLPVAGSVAASDAFFPFRDGVDALAEAGVTAVIEPGGSRRDEEVIAAANEHGMAMIFTGRRHFKH